MAPTFWRRGRYTLISLRVRGSSSFPFCKPCSDQKVRSHHNVGGLPEDFSLPLLEPLRMLFKDEVRQLGEELGLSKATLLRHPFPGENLL